MATATVAARALAQMYDRPITLLSDAPTSDHRSDGFPRSWIMYAPLGTFHHQQYGELHFTKSKLLTFKKHFDQGTRKIELALDADHKASEGDSRATGWVEEFQFREAHTTPDGQAQPAGLYALVRWTPYGENLIKSQEYRYFSPEFGKYTDEQSGQIYDDVPIGGALTNRPFLKVMADIKLTDISTRAWGSLDHDCLPDSGFLDPKNRRLPIYEGAGPKDAKGRYTQRGKININGVRAALRAIHGARSGKAMTGVPAGTVARLQRLLARYGGGGGDSSSAKAAEPSVEVEGAGMPRQARSQNGTATLGGSEGGEDSLFFMGGSSTMGSLKGGHPYKQGNKPATQGGGYDDDADDATDQPSFDDSDSDDDSAAMDDSGDDDSEGYDDSSDDDSGAEMDDGSGDDDESMGSRGTKRMRSRKASTKRASTKRAATKKASDTFNLEGSTSEIVRLREEVATYRLAIYRNEVHKQTLQLTERLGDAAPSRVFAQAFERFMLSDDGYRLSPHVRGEILKLCDLALKRGVVDLRRLGSGRDIERRTTTARNQGQGGGAKGLPTDGDELVEEAERMALSEGKLKMGRKFAELPTAEKDHYMSEAYRLLSDD